MTTRARRHSALPLVREGMLVGVLTSRDTAPALGPEARSNGTVRADGWGSLPLIRMPNIHLEPGAGTLEDLLADVDEGVYMLTNRSWSIDERRLDFAFGCEVAWEIKRGALGRRYRNPTYGGRTPGLLGLLRRDRRAGGVARLRHAQLRQGPAAAGRPGRARRRGRPVPRRHGGLRLMQWPREQPGHPVPGALAEAALEAATDAGAAQVEVSVQREVLGLARFANSELHQHVDRDDVRRPCPGRDRRTAASASAAPMCPRSTESPGWRPTRCSSHGSRRSSRTSPAWRPERLCSTRRPPDAATLDAGPQERAAAVQVVLSRMPAGVHAAGALTTGGLDLCVHTSAGQHAGAVLSTATLTVIATGQSSTGYAEGGSRALRDLDPADSRRPRRRQGRGRRSTRSASTRAPGR